MFGILLIFALIDLFSACPFYVMNVNRHNYTNFTSALQYSTNTNLPLRVCDASVLYDWEGPFVINSNLEVIGDADACGLGAYFNTSITSDVFVINGTADVSFRSLRIVFNGTLFSVKNSAELTLTYVNIMFGNIGISIDVPSSNVNPFTGTAVLFQFLDTGIKIPRATSIACQYCRFQQIKIGGILTRSSDISLISLPYVVSEDCIVLFGLTNSNNNAVTAITISDSFLLCHDVASCHSYAATCGTNFQSQSPVFGVGGGTGSGSTSASSTSSDPVVKGFVIGIFVLLFLILALAAIKE